jgi:hypothetical protein
MAFAATDAIPAAETEIIGDKITDCSIRTLYLKPSCSLIADVFIRFCYGIMPSHLQDVLLTILDSLACHTASFPRKL